VRIARDLPVDEPKLLTGRVAALWTLDACQVLKLILGTAVQDETQVALSKPESIETTELVHVQTRAVWTLSASLFRNRTSSIVRRIQEIPRDLGAGGLLGEGLRARLRR